MLVDERLALWNWEVADAARPALAVVLVRPLLAGEGFSALGDDGLVHSLISARLLASED